MRGSLSKRCGHIQVRTNSNLPCLGECKVMHTHAGAFYVVYCSKLFSVELIYIWIFKTVLALISTHSTTWKLKTIKFVQRPILKKPISDAGH